jgi:pSer/pThr/pTyr-binding forkhead associated (FHA) protein
MRVVLQVTGGPHANRRVVLRSGQSASVGRTPAADHQFPDDPLMSGRHFAIELTGPVCQIRDLGSRNGTFVDERLVAERVIQSGCVIQAGDTRFSVLIEESDAVSGVIAPPTSVAPSAAPKPSSLVNARVPSAVALSVAGLSVTAVSPREGASTGAINETAPAPELVLRRLQVPPEYQMAMMDDDPLVRRSALVAAAWRAQAWVIEYCRVLAARPTAENWETLQLLAILGQPDDLPRVLAIGRCAELSQQRFAIFGAFGHPQVMGEILAGVDSDDTELAQVAAAAFTKLTGLEVRSERGWATQQWQKLQSTAPQCLRWCHGVDANRELTPEVLKRFDLESRWEAALRGRYRKTWQAARLDDEQLADRLRS